MMIFFRVLEDLDDLKMILLIKFYFNISCFVPIGLKACKRIGNSQYMQKVGAFMFQTFYPGCEKYASDDDTYFRCQVESVLFTYHNPVGTARMGHPKDPTTVVDRELR